MIPITLLRSAAAIGITFVALVFGNWVHTARNLGGSRFSEATTLCDCRSYRNRMSNDTSRRPDELFPQ